MGKKSNHEGGLWTKRIKGNEIFEIIVRSEPSVLGVSGRATGIESCG